MHGASESLFLLVSAARAQYLAIPAMTHGFGSSVELPVAVLSLRSLAAVTCFVSKLTARITLSREFC